MEPHLIKNMTKLEDIQKFALRMCCKNWDAGYQELLDLTTMPTLENRRLYLKLCSLYKIIYGHFYFPPNVFTAQPSRTTLVSPLLNQPHACTNYYQSSFVPSTISVWNNLPHTALTAHTTQSFKAHIAPFFVTVLTAPIGYILELAVRIAIMYPLHYYYYCINFH